MIWLNHLLKEQHSGTAIHFSFWIQRWSILKQHISTLTVKPLCETRWESHVESVGVLRCQANEIHDALIDIAENLNDAQACSEAESLADAITILLLSQ